MTSVTFERACVCVCVCVCVCGFRHLFERRSVCVAFVAVAGRRGRPALPEAGGGKVRMAKK